VNFPAKNCTAYGSFGACIMSRDTRIIRDFFSSKAKEHGDSVRSLAWESDYTQQTRFAVLSEIAPLDGMRVLDVGCGKADLFAFLLDRGTDVNYYGVDFTRELLEIARKKYPGL